MRPLLAVLSLLLFLNGQGAKGITKDTRTTPPVGYSSVVQPSIPDSRAQQIIRLSTAQYLKSLERQELFKQQFRAALPKGESQRVYTKNSTTGLSKLTRSDWRDLSTGGKVLVVIGTVAAVVGLIVLEHVLRNRKR